MPHHIPRLAFGSAFLWFPILALSAPPTGIQLVQVPIVTGSQMKFYHLSWGSSRFQVGRITQDDRGFVWLGAADDLRRYDAYRFMRVQGDSEHPNPAGFIISESLMKDGSGMLWFGVEDEFLDRYDPGTGKLTQYRAAVGDPCGPLGPAHQITQDPEGMMWVATEKGLNRLDPVTSRITCYRHRQNDSSSIASNRIISTLESSRGTLWVASEGGLDVFDRHSGKVIRHISLESRSGVRFGLTPPPANLYEDRSGMLWAGLSSGADLASIDPATGFATVYSFRAPGLQNASSGVVCILEDQDGALWLASNGLGLLKLDRDRKRVAWYESNPDDPNSLSGNLVVGLFHDRDWSFWANTKGGDVYRFDPRAPVFRWYRHQPGTLNSLTDNYVLSAYEDSRGILWVGTERGLNRMDRSTGQVKRYEAGNFSVGVRSIAEDPTGDLWFGTRGNGLTRFDPRTGAFRTYRHVAADPKSLSHDYVASLLVDRKGTLWAATDYGIDRYDPETQQFQSYRPAAKSLTRYHTIAEEPGGALWLGSSEFGLDRFDPQTGKFTGYQNKPGDDRSLAHNRVYSVCVDHSGTVWAATYAGLDRFNPANDTFTQYDARDGLPANTALGIREDQSGNLWITTPDGLSRFDPQRGSFTNYYTSDGLPTDLFSVLVVASKSRSGEMFFGSYSGLVAFFPSEVVDHSSVPPVVLTDFRLFGEPVPLGKEPLKQPIWSTRFLTLPERSIFSFEFSALSYSDPVRNRYRYRLEGLETKWNEVDSTRRSATYTTLSPGSYTFRVQARTDRGDWSGDSVALPIRILPPWYATSLFRSVCVLLLSAFLWALYRYRLDQIAQEFNMTLEARVSERTRIARELHDTLLQSFHGLLLRFQSVDNLLPERPAEAKKRLASAIDQAAQAITEGRDAVQGLRSSTVESNDLARAISRLSVELAADETNPNPAVFHVAVEGTTRNLQPILRDEVYRIAGEALRNAFRHAEARRIEVEIRYDNRQFRLRVRDDGRGIDPKVLSQDGRAGHYGLHGMRERAKLVGGKLDVWSDFDSGTEIELIIPSSIAYATSPGSRLSWLSQKLSEKLSRKGTQMKS